MYITVSLKFIFFFWIFCFLNMVLKGRKENRYEGIKRKRSSN